MATTKGIPAWKIMRGLEEGKSFYQIAKELKCDTRNILDRCRYLGLKSSKVFTNKKEYKKLTKMRGHPNRILTMSSGYLSALGFGPNEEPLYYRMMVNNKTKRVELEILRKLPKMDVHPYIEKKRAYNREYMRKKRAKDKEMKT